MGDVIMFRPREVHSEAKALLESIADDMEKEAGRRQLIYGTDDPSPDLLRVLWLYPMLRLIHTKKARRCIYCEHRIAPLELHFVHDGAHICQSGICMDAGPK